MSRVSYAHIQDEAAYEAAIARRIQENARKGRGKRWLAEDPTRLALVNRLQAEVGGGFLGKMLQSYNDWYSLTEGQERAVRECFAKADARRAEFIAQDNGSQHIGEIGKRVILKLTCRKLICIETDYGMLRICIFNDASGNIVVYKGNSLLADNGESLVGEGWPVRLKATIKDHAHRDGIAQTVIARPKMVAA